MLPHERFPHAPLVPPTGGHPQEKEHHDDHHLGDRTSCADRPGPRRLGTNQPGRELFSTDITGLPGNVPTPTVQLPDGAVYDLRVAPVTKQIGDATVRMLAYNGSSPGPPCTFSRAPRWW